MKTLARLSNSDYSFDTVDNSVVVTRFFSKFDGYIFSWTMVRFVSLWKKRNP